MLCVLFNVQNMDKKACLLIENGGWSVQGEVFGVDFGADRPGVWGAYSLSSRAVHFV